MKSKNITLHVTTCHICWNMISHGYRSEALYWKDFFAKTEKPIKYKLFYKEKLTNEPKP